ncbi:DUF6668 family protein [Streptomyces sp. AC512_CC834]|uniref:DUF6668 family protein n=1 Tax=Streptomyces sp. AC512_CC834 TaxID=2823691 RepID=UPI001C264EE5|nr:DUF6668 family protein [Streptomyces sp. AC512_CC834]
MRQGPEIWIRGPVTVPEPPAPEPPPASLARHHSWVGTHGGAGVSTLAAVYGGHDCGRRWPGPADPPSVLLVARTHAAGLVAVARGVEDFRRGRAPAGVDLDSVVLVADAPGRLPRPLAQRVRLLESTVDVHRVPWVPAWRLGEVDAGPPRGTDSLCRLTRRVR